MELYIAALTIGLLGSFHCIGMCGPIAIALPLKTNSWFSRVFGGVLYNIGRAITYGLMGAVFGLIGKGLQLGGLQRWVSIAMGIIMILSVLFPVLFKNQSKIDGFVTKMVGGLKKSFGKMFAIRTYYSLFIIGILNGFLPCGLVYMAIAGAIATGEVLDGTIYMVIFGLGTLPIMLSLSLISNVISVKFRNKIRRIIPIFIIIVGLLFILRGMDLGIKYISPKFSEKEPTEVKCCH